MTEIKFKNLSVCLKIPIVISWAVGGLYLFYFIIGFIQGAGVY